MSRIPVRRSEKRPLAFLDKLALEYVGRDSTLRDFMELVMKFRSGEVSADKLVDDAIEIYGFRAELVEDLFQLIAEHRAKKELEEEAKKVKRHDGWYKVEVDAEAVRREARREMLSLRFSDILRDINQQNLRDSCLGILSLISHQESTFEETSHVFAQQLAEAKSIDPKIACDLVERVVEIHPPLSHIIVAAFESSFHFCIPMLSKEKSEMQRQPRQWKLDTLKVYSSLIDMKTCWTWLECAVNLFPITWLPYVNTFLQVNAKSLNHSDPHRLKDVLEPLSSRGLLEDFQRFVSPPTTQTRDSFKGLMMVYEEDEVKEEKEEHVQIDEAHAPKKKTTKRTYRKTKKEDQSDCD